MHLLYLFGRLYGCKMHLQGIHLVKKWTENWLLVRKMSQYLHCAILSVCNDIGQLFLVLYCPELVLLSLRAQNLTYIDYFGLNGQIRSSIFAKNTPKIRKIAITWVQNTCYNLLQWYFDTILCPCWLKIPLKGLNTSAFLRKGGI